MKLYNKILLTNTAGKKSSTLTVFVLGAIIVNVKLLFSGLTIAGFTVPVFSGGDYGLALASLGAIYVLRRNTDPTKTNQPRGGE